MPTPELNDLGQPHERCKRWNHGGPCWGALRFELPEMPDEKRERHVSAVYSVLRRSGLVVTGARRAEYWALAEELLAAADTGI